MPIKIPDKLPARTQLEDEGVEIITQETALRQDVRPLKILLLNLMPKKRETEIQFARLLSNTPLQIELTLMTTASYQPQNTPADYLLQFYRRLPDVRDEFFDGLIVTGAPIERIDFEKVDYWSELGEIIDWSGSHVLRRLGICWGAQAMLYHLHGVDKFELPEKLFGVFDHALDPGRQRVGLLAGFTDRFPMPVSRFTGNRAEDIATAPNLSVLARAPESGVALVIDDATKDVFVLNHLEYDADTLSNEFTRDVREGLEPKLPVNYFPSDDPLLPPVNRWRTYAFLLFANWIKDVYHDAPFDLSTLPSIRR
ncbi:MAG: homoserine O-succinyltransferase [Deltaproteobacteria bacterium]|nr:homoserine O-succinyltransferase [Deltaproteobacteria bacterium]